MDKDAQENMIKLLSENLRQDKRGFEDFRNMSIELGVVEMPIMAKSPT